MSNQKEHDQKVNKATTLTSKADRPKRSRLQRAGKMYIDPKHFEAGYHYRIVNDVPGEIARRRNMGYEVVIDKDIEIGDQVTSNAKGLGSAVSVIVNDKGMRAILMRMPSDEYQEIIDELNEENTRIEKNYKTRALAEAGGSDKDVYGGITSDQV